MKKAVKIAGSVLGVAAVFGVGSIVGASSDWKAEAINGAYSKFLDTASSTTNDLTKNVDEDINKEVQSKISGDVKEQEEELQRLLNEYYQMKISNTANGEEMKALESQIEQIKQNVLESYEREIDKAFVGK